MGEYLGAVHSFPAEGIMGHTVKLIPADLGGHKHVNTGFLQNLRQSPGIAEHIGEPQIFHIFPKFLFQESAADEELPGQGFSAGQVAVRFHPHAAVGFPASFFHPFLDLCKDFREVFLDIFINLRLCLKEDIFREHFHHAQHRRKRTGSLLMSMLQSPQPRHINVGMSYTVYIYRRMFLHFIDFVI